MIGEQPARQVHSVDTAFSLLQLLQDLDGAMTNELARELDIAKSTVHNYLQTLESLGYVVEDDGTYRLGLRFLTHGMAARNSLTIKDVVTSSLAAATAELSMPTWWVVEEFGRGIFVDRRLPTDQTAIYGRVGKRSFLHAHAPGKAILACLPEDYRSRVLDYHGLPSYTRETITDDEELTAEIERTRERGYAVDDGGAALGVKSIGTAFEDSYGYTHAIGVFGYSHEFTGGRHDRDIPSVLRETVQTIEESTGGKSA